MTTIADTIAPERVLLDLNETTPRGALERVASLLRTDPHVLDFDALLEELVSAAPCAAEEGCEFGICIPHARTDAVTGIVISVGRANAGVIFPDCEQPIRYIFCIGVPTPMDADYLRIVGLLARILKDPKTEQDLRAAKTAKDFVLTLSRLEAKL